MDGRTRRTRGIWARLLLISVSSVGCASGDSSGSADSSSPVVFPSTASNATTGPDDGDSEKPSGDDDDGSDGTDGTQSSGPSSATNPSDPTHSTAGTTSGPPLSCMFADDCDDLDLCTADNCVNSECAHEPLNCDDGIACTLDGCNPASGACEHTPDDTQCDDADLCTGVETCSAAVGCQPGAPVICDDSQACTADACNPATGQCGFETIDTCAGGDGCCPGGCSVAADADCVCTNLATSATPSSSGGGVDVGDGTGYGPEKWVDGAPESACNSMCTNCFGWINNSSVAAGAFMQLDWPAEVTIGSMFVDGVAGGSCQSANRALAGGTIQYWSGGAWVNAGSFAGQQGDLDFSFDPPLTTTRLRIDNVVAPAGGNNSLAFEWYVYEPLGCTP